MFQELAGTLRPGELCKPHHSLDDLPPTPEKTNSGASPEGTCNSGRHQVKPLAPCTFFFHLSLWKVLILTGLTAEPGNQACKGCKYARLLPVLHRAPLLPPSFKSFPGPDAAIKHQPT